MNNLNFSFLGLGNNRQVQADIPQPQTHIDPKLLTKDRDPTKKGNVNMLNNMKNKKIEKIELKEGETVKDVVKKTIEDKPSLKELRRFSQN